MDSTERHRYLVAAEAAGAGVAEEEAEVKPLEVAPVWVNLPEAVCGSGSAKARLVGSLRAMGSDVPLRQSVLTSHSLVSA